MLNNRSGAFSTPDVVVIGAQKGGTTALFRYLSEHPQLIPCSIKEPHYFSCDSIYERGADYYRSLFPTTASGLTFDASPSYLHNPQAAKRIFEHNSSAKIIIALRDPVERAYSAWNMYQDRYQQNRDWYFDNWIAHCGTCNQQSFRRKDSRITNFLSYVTDEIDFMASGSSGTFEAPVISHGHYYQQITRYLPLFGAEQILILENRKLRTQTLDCLKKIEQFLSIAPFDWSRVDLSPVHEGAYIQTLDEPTRLFLQEHYASPNEQLFKLLGHRYDHWSLP